MNKKTRTRSGTPRRGAPWGGGLSVLAGRWLGVPLYWPVVFRVMPPCRAAVSHPPRP